MLVSSGALTAGKTRGLKPWRVYGRHGRLAAVIEAFDRNHADHMVDCMVEEHRPYHDSCQSHTCDLWGLPGYGFVVQGTREYWSVMKFGSVGDPDSDEGADTTYNVHPDCRGHRHLTREDAAACPAMTDEWAAPEPYRRVRTTIIHWR